MSGTAAGASGDNPVRPPGITRDLVAGLLLVTVAAGAFFGTTDLSNGEGAGIGPGLMPRGIALLLGGVGALIVVLSFFGARAPIGGIALRGPLFVLGSVVLFAVSIRTLGLAFAGPLAVIVSALADRDSRPLEIIIFAAALTLLCVGLFKFALRLPIPLAPMLLGY
ncbi:MAG: tripartite tricarboxylate transporter TctB family protein [Acetobacteraceae bacterium]|nr:tripartite tricarboxylate transporter TctB family protein [Acetobacteraceae bacterium]MSP29887.1 tripartite tricarboxylate transporter TctB family protein [Acetobacteraceae bacterium]